MAIPCWLQGNPLVTSAFLLHSLSLCLPSFILQDLFVIKQQVAAEKEEKISLINKLQYYQNNIVRRKDSPKSIPKSLKGKKREKNNTELNKKNDFQLLLYWEKFYINATHELRSTVCFWSSYILLPWWVILK